MSGLPLLQLNGATGAGKSEVQGTAEAELLSPILSASSKVHSHGVTRIDYWGKALRRLHQSKRDCIQKALEKQRDVSDGKVHGNEAGEIASRSLEVSSTSWPEILSEVCRHCQRLEDERKKKKNIRFAGREVNLHKTLEMWIKFFNKIKHVGDIAVNVDPIHAGLPWAAIRLILTAVTASSDQNGAVYMGIEKVLFLLNRGAAYELLLAHLRSRLSAEILTNFEEALIQLYKCLLEFLAVALTLRDKNAFKRAIYAFWTPQDIGSFCENSTELETTLDIESKLLESQCNRETAEHVEKLLKASDYLEDMVTDTKSLIQALSSEIKEQHRREQEERENEEALSWVSSIPILDHHENAREGRTPETGQWVFTKPEFLSWTASSGSSLLWIHGIPGAGKTKLVTTVVDHFLQLRQSPQDQLPMTKHLEMPKETSDPSPLAFFYCRRTDSKRRQPENVLRSFLKQLALSHDKSLASLRTTYMEKKRQGFLSRTLSIRECQDLLIKMISLCPEAILILDALDECEEESRHNLIAVLNQLVQHRLPVKILISSRRDDDITAEFEDKVNFSLSATENHGDIMRFVQEKIREYRNSKTAKRKLNSAISAELEQKIIQVFLEKSNGMFQWAALHLAHLLSLDRPSDIAKALQKLPRGLEKTYGEIFERIMDPEYSLRDIAIRTFLWLLAQGGTADSDQLLVVACQDLEDNEIHSVDIDHETILKACQNLVVVENPLDQFNFSRWRPRSDSYRLGTGPPPPPPPLPLLRAMNVWRTYKQPSTTKPHYVDSKVLSDNFVPPFPPIHPMPPKRIGDRELRPPRAPSQHSAVHKQFYGRSLFRFAHLSVQEYCETIQWTQEAAHAFAAKMCLLSLLAHRIQPPITAQSVNRPEPPLKPEIMHDIQILQRFADSAWIYHMQRCSVTGSGSQDEKLIALANKFLGFPNRTSLAFDAWESRFSWDTSADLRFRPIFWSTQRKEKVESIDPPPMQYGMKPVDDKYEAPIYSRFVFQNQSVLVVCFFGFDNIFFPPASNSIALPAPVSPTLWPFARTASFYSHFSTPRMLRSILEPLVQADAEQANKVLWDVFYSFVNHPLGLIYTKSFPDYFSLCLGFAILVHKLQIRDAVEMCGMIITILLYPPVLEAYLPRYPDDHALQAASQIVQLGANIDHVLQEALKRRSWSHVVWLIARGAKPDTTVLATVLEGSVFNKFPPFHVCQLLVANGADVNTSIGSFWIGTPILAASINGDIALVQILAGAGANVNALPQNPSLDSELRGYDAEASRGDLSPFGTALVEASARGYTEIIQLLLDHGAFVNEELKPVLGYFGTPLIAACAFNHDLTCKMLLECGIDAKTITWRTSHHCSETSFVTNALITAASSGGLEICRLLISRGTDVNVIIHRDGISGFRSQGTALIAAASNGHIGICELLIHHGARVDVVVPDACFPTALIGAASKGKWKVCELLLNHGSEINLFVPNLPYGNALIAACRWRHLQTIELLVQKGADMDINTTTNDYSKRLLAACMGIDSTRSKVIELMFSRSSIHSLEEHEVDEEALELTRKKLKAASSITNKIDLRHKRAFSQVQEELQRKVASFSDDFLIDLFYENELPTLFDLIYDPLVITKKLRSLAKAALRRIAGRLPDKVELGRLFERFPLLAADVALSYTEDIRTARLLPRSAEQPGANERYRVGVYEGTMSEQYPRRWRRKRR